MSGDDFVRVRETFADSVIGRIMAAAAGASRSAWRTSATGNAARSLAARLTSMDRASLTARLAIVLAIAAGLQPLLMMLMPRTVVPALPWPAFAIVAVFAALVAWRANEVVTAWDSSRLARWIRR